MRRVIEHKKTSHLELLPFYEFTKYQKITLSQDNVDTIKHKRKPWYIEHIEKSPIDSSRLILPLTVDETVTKTSTGSRRTANSTSSTDSGRLE